MMERRDLARAAEVAAARLVLSPGLAVRRVPGANDRIGVGVMGAGGMGHARLRDFLRTGQVDVAAVADLHELRLNQMMEMILGCEGTLLVDRSCYYGPNWGRRDAKACRPPTSSRVRARCSIPHMG